MSNDDAKKLRGYSVQQRASGFPATPINEVSRTTLSDYKIHQHNTQTFSMQMKLFNPTQKINYAVPIVDKFSRFQFAFHVTGPVNPSETFRC